MDPETGRIKLIWEVVAGGMAGGCQVVCIRLVLLGITELIEFKIFTNPLEIV